LDKGQDEKTPQNENLAAGFSEVMVIPPGDSRISRLTPADYTQLAGEWFNLDVANGDARADTIKTYGEKITHWFRWCAGAGVDPGNPHKEDIKLYRKYLIERETVDGTGVGKKLSHAYIQSLLTVVRRFYDGAVARGYLQGNPATAVKPPRNRTAKDQQVVHLTAGEAELLFRSLPAPEHSLKGIRDRVIIALMMLEGLRRVEIHRANVEDIEDSENGGRILVHGKGKDGYIYPREDVMGLLKLYLNRRGQVTRDESGEPLFSALSKGGKPLGRITRIGLSKLIDTLYSNAAISRPHLACHALRHTCGAQLYQQTRDVKVVQETLRHATIAMAAKYSHIQDRGKARHTQSIPIKPA
jgi:integrase/recombinase XerC/integrase/recombinase XerD